MGQQFKLENVQVNWPTLFVPRTSKNFPNNPPTFRIVTILDPKQHGGVISQIKESMDSQMKTAFNGATRPYPSSWTPQADGKIHLRSSAGADRKPQVVDQNVNLLHADNGEIYAGCFCNVVIDVYVTTYHGGKVAVGLLAVQKVADGDRLDNRPAAEDLFKPIDVQGGNPLM